MSEKESGSCLAEIRGIEGKETTSGRSTRTSFAKLPRIGIFSSSTNSINDASPKEITEVQSDDASKLPAKPSSRQGTERASTVTTQQLEIHINLSNVIDPTQAVTIKKEETRKEDLDSKEANISNKLAAIPSNDPPIWERGNGIKAKEERPRTKTWPALQYRLWLDASNLPLHLLSNDERANRPPYLLHLLTTRKSQKFSHPGSSNETFKVMSTDGKRNKDWSGNFLNVLRPPFRPDMKRNDSGVLNRKTDKERKGVEGAAAVNGLQVGVGESWQVASSYARRPESHHSGQNQKSIPGRLKSILSVNLPQANQAGKVLYPRIPSRMGPNNFEAFLKQNTSLGGMSHSSESNPERRPQSSSSKLAAAHNIISPRHFCSTSAEVNLLTLRSYARNPKMLQELGEKSRESKLTNVHHNKLLATEAIELSRDGVRHVRFKVPCGNEDDCQFKEALARSKHGGMMKRTLTDVTPPQTPPTFDHSFRISVVPRFSS